MGEVLGVGSGDKTMLADFTSMIALREVISVVEFLIHTQL